MPIILIVLIGTCLVSVLAFQNPDIRNRFIFNPYIIHHQRQWYRFFSSGMIHADVMHLGVNMFVLYSFGIFVEARFQEIFQERATLNFLLLYFGGMVVSVIPTYKKNENKPEYNALGASGAVSAVVFTTILLQPLHPLGLYFVIELPGIIFGVLYLIYCYYATRKGGSNVNHDAHMWGALFGFVFPAFLKPTLFFEFLNQLPFLHASF